MQIFRVEHQDSGCGPYMVNGICCDHDEEEWCDEECQWERAVTLSSLICAAHENNEHPSPKRDAGLRYIVKGERCGFASLDALFTWFDGFIEDLHHAGFVVRIYEDATARVSQFTGQACFVRRTDPLDTLTFI